MKHRTASLPQSLTPDRCPSPTLAGVSQIRSFPPGLEVGPDPMASSAGGAQQTAHQLFDEFLVTALSQRGPSALPYDEDVKSLIRNHLLALAGAFPSLHPNAAVFTDNGGCEVRLLHAAGTIPIHHAGASYNLPVVIWLPESYPGSPPLVFLSPTRDMVINPNHCLVHNSGLVDNAPYLRSWERHPSSSLVDLVESLSHLFGKDPPLFTLSLPFAHTTRSQPDPIDSSGPRVGSRRKQTS